MGKALKAAGQLVESDPAAARALLDSSAKVLAELDTVVRGIRPAVLADRALAGAIRALARDTPVRVFVDDGLSGRPPAPVESAGYFAVREVLANVVKDSGARRVWIDVRHDDDMLHLGVTHDGTSPATAGGLHGVERLLAAAGGVAAVSPPGDLTTIAMEIPCAVADASAMAKAARLAAPAPELACMHNPGGQDAFYVYENWTLRKAVLHRGECRFCNHGRGQRASGETPNGKWHGPYVSEDMARSDPAAQQYVLIHVRAQPQEPLVQPVTGERAVEAHRIAADEQHEHRVGFTPFDPLDDTAEVPGSQGHEDFLADPPGTRPRVRPRRMRCRPGPYVVISHHAPPAHSGRRG
ncbi:MAG: hypothetical protein ABSA93_14675 [Streptosporangiaceae bacterium]